jgi:subtilisin family serine protease
MTLAVLIPLESNNHARLEGVFKQRKLMDPALYELISQGKPLDEVAVVIRLHDPARLPVGVRVIANFGHIVTARVSRNAIVAVRDDPAVASMKAPRGISPDLEPDLGDAVAEPLGHDRDANRPSGLPVTGRGTVIGVVDWGCDFSHPDFRHEDGSTRLLGLWDQRNVSRETTPYGYGRIFSPNDLNAALQIPDPHAALGYFASDADHGLGSHGTHTLGIAAGNGRGGGPVGLAPEAEIVFVHLGAREGPNSVPLSNSHELLEAIDFIRVTAGKRPVAINLSLGRHAGDHTGLSLVERAFDEWVSLEPGRAIVQSCGNYFERRAHASWVLRPGEIRTFKIIVDPNDKTTNELDLWYSGRDRLKVKIRSSDGRIVTSAKLGERSSAVLDGRDVVRLYHREHDPNNGDHQISAYLEVVPGVTVWEVTLSAIDLQDGRVHAWIERDSGCRACQAKFSEDEADVRHTSGSICNGFRTIAVGAYDAHKTERPIARFSSSGPTRDGRPNPHLVAPGVMIRAARSRPLELGDYPMYTRMSGTSMAAPHVTGTVALMFEAAGAMPISTTRKTLLAACDSAPEGADDVRLYSGYLNIAQAVRAAFQTKATPQLQEAEMNSSDYNFAAQTNLNSGINRFGLPGFADSPPQQPLIAPAANDSSRWVTFKQDLVRIANEEYRRWHPNGRARSETDPGMREVLKNYWMQGPGLTSAAADEAIDSRRAWSAAFISWVMRQAGAHDTFRYSSGHTVYCAAAKRNRARSTLENPFWLYRINEYAPQVGDLICTGRQNSGVGFDNVDDGQFRASHCDIVLAVDAGSLSVVGGNVGDTVGRKIIRTDARGLLQTDHRQSQYYAVMRVRTQLATEWEVSP